MSNNLLGTGLPFIIELFISCLMILLIVGCSIWTIRRFALDGSRFGDRRAQWPRISEIDHSSVDTRRRLILVRRDNVEHLLMIGGPTDLVIEPNIVRALAAPREIVPNPMTLPAETAQAIPLSETDNSSWPHDPEPSLLPRAAPRSPPTARPNEMQMRLEAPQDFSAGKTPSSTSSGAPRFYTARDRGNR